MPTSSETGIRPSSSYNLRSRPLPKTATTARKSARENKENANPGPVTRNAAKISKIPVPGNSKIPVPRSGRPAAAGKDKAPQSQPSARRRKVPDFEKLHKNWNKKFEQGKAVVKKPCTQSNAFDLTRPGTRFKRAFFDGSVEKKEPRHVARTGNGNGGRVQADFGNGFEVDVGALNRILNGDGLEDECDDGPAPPARSRATLAGTGASETFGRNPTSRQTLGGLPSRGVGRVNNSSNVAASSRDWDRKSLGRANKMSNALTSRNQMSLGGRNKSLGRKSLLEEQKDIDLQFEASADSLASILNNTGLKSSIGHGPNNGGRQTIAGMSARHRQSGRFNPTTGRASIYYQRPKNYDVTKVYSEFAKKTLSRLTLDGKESKKVNSTLIDSLLPDNRGSIYIKQSADQCRKTGAVVPPTCSVGASRSPGSSMPQSLARVATAITPGRVPVAEAPKSGPAISHKTPGTASRVPNPHYQELQRRQDLSCSPALRDAPVTNAKLGLTPAIRIPTTPGGQSQKNVRWADVLSSPSDDSGAQDGLTTKDVATVLNFGDDANDQLFPEPNSRLEEVEKLEAETAVNRQKLNEMEEIERQLEMEIARLHETETLDNVNTTDQVPTKQPADHMEPIKLPKETAPQDTVPRDNIFMPSQGVPRDLYVGFPDDHMSSSIPKPVDAWAAEPQQEVSSRMMGHQQEMPSRMMENQQGMSSRIIENQQEIPSRYTVPASGILTDQSTRAAVSQDNILRGTSYLNEGMQNLSLNPRASDYIVNISRHPQAEMSQRNVFSGVTTNNNVTGRDMLPHQMDGLEGQQDNSFDSVLLDSTECFRGILPPFLPNSDKPPRATSSSTSNSVQPSNISTRTNNIQVTYDLRTAPRPHVPGDLIRSPRFALPQQSATERILVPSNQPAVSSSLSSLYPGITDSNTPLSLQNQNELYGRSESTAGSTLLPKQQLSAGLSGVFQSNGGRVKVPAPESASAMTSLQPNTFVTQIAASPRVPILSNPHLYSNGTAASQARYNAHPSAAQIHTPQPSRRRGTSFTKTHQGALSLSTPLHAATALQVPPPIHTPLAMRHSALAQSTVMAKQPHSSGSNLVASPVLPQASNLAASQHAPRPVHPEALSQRHVGAAAPQDTGGLLQSTRPLDNMSHLHLGIGPAPVRPQTSVPSMQAGFTVNSAFQQRPSRDLDTMSGHMTSQDGVGAGNVRSAAMGSGTVGSLSLSESLKAPAVRGIQPTSEKESVGQLFHHVLLDEECALYACRLRGRFMPEPAEPRPLDPIAKVLLYGDDMHFVPVRDTAVASPVAMPTGSAFSSYLMASR